MSHPKAKLLRQGEAREDNDCSPCGDPLHYERCLESVAGIDEVEEVFVTQEL